jgi:peptidoglycan hydrolase-like protein with peptidoglycan-binding domain
LNTETYLALWGLDVAVLKNKLRILDFYRGEVDNEYTPDLTDALAAFQRHHSMLHVDGYFGELTYKQMVTELIMADQACRPQNR